MAKPKDPFKPVVSDADDDKPPVLDHIVAVCRLSSRKTDDKGKVTDLSKRGYELAHLAETSVRKTSPNVTKTAIVLNGVSSNVDTSEDARIAPKLVELRTALQQEPTSPQGYVLLVVSTLDGLWTNVYSFAKFFVPLAHLSLQYMIYEEHKSIIVTVQTLLHTIYSMLEQDHPTSPLPIDPNIAELVKRLVAISYGKYYMGTGHQGVRLATGGGRRNVIPIAESLSPYNVDPAIRVVRAIRVGGPDRKPQFVHAEEKRWQLPLERGMLVCPVQGCTEVFARLDDLVVHIMAKIYSVDHLVCPLCPVELRPWNFHSVVQGVQHILRHLSAPTYYREQDKCKAQCPLCLKLIRSTSSMFDHVVEVHVRALEVRTSAILTGIATVDDVESTEDYLQTSARNTDHAALEDLPRTYHKLKNLIDRSASMFRWTTATLSDPRQLPGLLPDLPEFVQKSVVTMGSPQPDEKWFKAYVAPRTDITGNQRRKDMFQVLVQTNQDGHLLCPLPDTTCGCGAYFPDSEAACNHIGEILKILPASEQVCPWCPSPKNAEIIFKSAGKFHHNDVRHLQRHLPKDCHCRFCNHKSASPGDLILHVKSVHLKFRCMARRCFERFATAADLAEHAKEHESRDAEGPARSTLEIAASANVLIEGSGEIDSADVSTIAMSDSETSVSTIIDDVEDSGVRIRGPDNAATPEATHVIEDADEHDAMSDVTRAPITLHEIDDSDDDIRGPRKRIRLQSTDAQGSDDDNTHDADNAQLHNPMLDEQDALASGDSDIDSCIVDDDAPIVYDTDASESEDDRRI